MRYEMKQLAFHQKENHPKTTSMTGKPYLQFLFYRSPETSDFSIQLWAELVVELMEIPQQVKEVVCMETDGVHMRLLPLLCQFQYM